MINIFRVYYIFSQGIAKRLVGAAIQEAARKREMRYKDIKKIEKGIRRHFHDDISVIVIYLNQRQCTHGATKSKQNNSVGCVTAPFDIFSYYSEENELDTTYEKSFLEKETEVARMLT